MANGAYRALIAGSGRADGLVGGRPDRRRPPRRASSGEHIRNVRLLERFALLEVPEADADRVVAAVNAAGGVQAARPSRRLGSARMSQATISTNHGDIEIELFDDAAPKTVENFKKLASDGFYDGLIFHRVIRTS